MDDETVWFHNQMAEEVGDAGEANHSLSRCKGRKGG